MTSFLVIGPTFDPASLRLLEQKFWLLEPRQRDALLRHGFGQPTGARTLGNLGEKYGVTRERIRQLESEGRRVLRDALDALLPNWRERFVEAFADREVIHFNHVAQAISTGATGLACAPVILKELKFQPIKITKWWYSRDPQNVQRVIESLSPTGPILKSEWDEALTSSGLPSDYHDTVARLTPSVAFGQYLVRKSSQRRDKIAAVLIDGALPMEEIVARTKLSSNSVRGALDYFDDFVSLSKSRWALTGTVEAPKYRSTLPAVLDILKEHGPQHYAALVRKVTAVHDVTPWRVDECLDDYRIGHMTDGRIWLVEYGAERLPEAEPERPDYLVAIGDRVGVRQKVTYDHARGSGFAVHRWLSWRLGLRATPQSITFDSEIGADLTVTRTGRHASLSSIRTTLDHYGLVEGCDFIILLDLDQRTWTLNHACTAGTCPGY